MKKLFTLAFLCVFALGAFAQELGEVDSSFGTDGTFIFHPSKENKFGYFDKVYKVLVQEDGKILTIGESRTDGYNYAIYISRHNDDGTLDETYGEDGYVFLKVDPLIYRNCPYDAVLSEDGLLYIAGFTYNGLNSAFVLCLDENGFENVDYGNEGWVVTEQDPCGIVYEAIDIDSKGRCVIAGYYNDEILVCRYTKKGELDVTFGNDGKATLELDADPAAHSYAFDLKVLDDGKIILCGDKRLGNAEEGMFIWSHMIRLKSNGTLDETFAENGVLYLYAGEYAEFALSLAVQPNGKYLVGGHAELLSNTPEMPRYESYITRVNIDGTIDETFGTEGFVKMEPLQGDGRLNNSYSILAAPDGQIFGAIYSRDIATEMFRAYVYNLDENGQFNENFAGSGIVPLPKVYEEQGEIDAYSIALQGNDKLIIGGYAAYDDPAVAGPGDYTKIYLTRIHVAVEGNGNDENDTTSVVGNYENRFEIHPNPATTTISIEGALNDNAQVSIIDLTGRCVKEIEVSDAVSTINIEDIESGVYFISVKQNDNNFVEKLVVK